MLLPWITKHLTTTIIAPHGITDLIHAQQNNNTMNLMQTYAITNSAILLLNQIHFEPMINILLFFGSVVHFKKDFPVKNNDILTGLLLLYFIFLDNESLFIYLTCLHVPNHYKLNWKYLIQNKTFSLLVVGITTIVFHYFGDYYFDLFQNPFYMDIIKGIILSHIIYEEKYIF